jgi:hypothetical protein
MVLTIGRVRGKIDALSMLLWQGAIYMLDLPVWNDPGSLMSDDYCIKEIRPVIGDWSCVSTERDGRWFIERIIAWALVEAKGSIDHVQAVLTNGIPHTAEGDAYFVPSSDVGFLGIPWGEIYKQVVPDSSFVREITDQVRAKSEKL